MNPRYVSVEDVPADVLAEGEREYGDRDLFLKQAVLLEQAFIKDPKRTIRDLVKDYIARLGENIVVRRFARFELGVGTGAAGEE